MARVFISYKRADKAIVFPLKDKIEVAIGEPCWIDLNGIESDAQFVKNIITAIDEASIVLFMYSQQHAKITDYTTDWTVRELSYAQKTGKRIVFINLDGTPLAAWITFMFPQQQQIDATSQLAIEHLLVDLTQWLNIETTSSDKDFHKFESLFHLETDGVIYFFRWIKKEAVLYEANIPTETFVIPTSVQHFGKKFRVTAINIGAFDKAVNLKKIVIPDTIRKIGFGAFSDCINLQSIELPEGIKRIKQFTFSNCTNLRSVRLPNSLKSIGAWAFSGCTALRDITIPKGTLVSRFAFDDGINIS